ncbi:MAG: TatD family deoxyribonuclease [Verrucomicrobia bacterium]|nr:TatD family deoxyribonuclease [Verrucomicrobiota bacterium]
MLFYDTHAHLDFPDFAHDLADAIERAKAAGVSKIITIGTDLASSARAIELAERFANVYAAVGWHPGHVSEAPADVRPALRKLASHPKVVAIGETGLDYHRLPSKTAGFGPADEQYKQRQADLFQQQLEVAAELGFNCIVHQRDSLQDALRQIEPFAGRLRGVFHCFVDDVPAMQRIVAMGSLVSFTGIVTFKNAQNVRDTLAAAPLDRLMLETDCPFLAPMPYRGKRCEPAYVREIALAIAQVKNCTLEELGKATCATAEAFFPKLR